MSTLNGRILVTGGAGFIGSALIWALNQRGHTNIVVTDILGSDEKWKNLVPLRFADYVEADFFREHLRKNPAAFGRFSTVFHLGACSVTTEKNASYLVDNNYHVTKELAAWSLEHASRFIYASSAATYGDGAQGMDDTSEDLARLIETAETEANASHLGPTTADQMMSRDLIQVAPDTPLPTMGT